MQWVEDVAAKASEQDALITITQWRDAKAPDKAIDVLLDAGWVRRLRRGVYGFAAAPSTWRQHLHAAALAAGGTVSHSCAATLWEFRHLPYMTFELTVTRTHRSVLPGVKIHHVSSLPDADITHRFGMPSTTFERTLVDCSTVLSPFQLLANLDDGLRRRIASVCALRECAERLRAGPGRRLSVIDWVLERRPNGYNPGGSHAERRVLDVLVAAGLPAPVQQHRMRVDGKTYYLDYAYPDRKLFIEYYGGAWHGTPSAMVYDNARITDMTALHWLPLIFTDQTPDRVIVEKTALALDLPIAATPRPPKL